ncbi:hypothetical protein [Pseudoalteromonas sp. GutCa3]|uniref:hypothetical protein n=1 Tax=Pseudoalteromonas sp. GutCa3 TaxID=888433 RepID=UPI000C32481A|nr:hypothetical protein [Pseudoalteromonas sp. GutCa3]PKG68614.1 hypothetical protein CXF64_20035 [Pseudoalteromonas sp. GutCa3]
MRVINSTGFIFIVSSLLLTGCSQLPAKVQNILEPLVYPLANIEQEERVAPNPNFFINFSNGVSDFNNSFLFQELLSNSSDLVLNGRPVVVFVANGNNHKDYELAISRLYSVVNTEAFDAEYRIIVKPLEREEQRNRLAVYLTDDWNYLKKQFMYNSDYSLVAGDNGVYRSSDERLLLARPSKFTFHPKSGDGVNQLKELLVYLGWDINTDNVVAPISIAKINKVDLVTLNSIASRSEVNLILSELFPKVLPNFTFLISDSERVVRVIKKDILQEN